MTGDSRTPFIRVTAMPTDQQVGSTEAGNPVVAVAAVEPIVGTAAA